MIAPALAALVTGAAAGVLHVWSGPDHLAVLSPYAVRHGGRAWRLGVRWGVGHALGTLLIAAVALVVRSRLDLHGIVRIGERLVGVTLIAVGVWALRRALSAHVHAHEHVHGGETHLHLHAHAPGAGHDRKRAGLHAHGHAVLGVGLLHGAAGGAHLWATLPALLLPLAGAASYLCGYAIGSIAAMALFAGAVGGALERLPGRALRWHRIALTGAAVLSLGVGAWWLLGGGA